MSRLFESETKPASRLGETGLAATLPIFRDIDICVNAVVYYFGKMPRVNQFYMIMEETIE